jgi:transposase InsO family protein
VRSLNFAFPAWSWRGLITSPAFILMRAADRFANPTTAPNQLWQTEFTYLKVIGWGWFYLSTVLDDFSRYILAWKLCTTMSVGNRRVRYVAGGAARVRFEPGQGFASATAVKR